MTEETMREVRKAFLEDTLKKLLGQDSPTGFTEKVVTVAEDIAREQGVDHSVDIYPHYGSDAGAAWYSGMDCRAALIGPGVHASHGMERTHLDGLRATLDLAALYLELA